MAADGDPVALDGFAQGLEDDHHVVALTGEGQFFVLKGADDQGVLAKRLPVIDLGLFVDEAAQLRLSHVVDGKEAADVAITAAVHVVAIDSVHCAIVGRG